MLEELDVVKRVRAVQADIAAQLEIALIQQKLKKTWHRGFTDAPRRAYLREQLKAIKKELREEDDGGSEQHLEQLRVRLEQAQLPTDVMAQAERELKRLGFIPEASPEHSRSDKSRRASP